MSKVKKPSNKTLIQNYLTFYQHSKQSMVMRQSCLNYFFNDTIQNKIKNETYKGFGYKGHVFNITTAKLKEYFIWLKNLDRINITTKKSKWSILCSFLDYTMEDHESFMIKIPRKTISWNGTKTNGNKKEQVFATKDELTKILNFLKEANFKHYLIIRLLIETGARKGEIINLKTSEVNIKERYINTHIGKTGEKYYFYSEKLANLLELYINERLKILIENPYFFITKFKDHYHNRNFNLILQNALKQLKINKKIRCHSLRKSINQFRLEMGCNTEDRKKLLGHKSREVNIANYTKNDLATLQALYDKWMPYNFE